VEVRALAFDVFGTLLNWRSTIASAFRESGLSPDPEELADDWRARAVAATQALNQQQRRGEPSMSFTRSRSVSSWASAASSLKTRAAR
jgi:FMN phosphatase YigB (HAD superfamily)